MEDDAEVWVLSPDADDKTKGAFYRTLARMAANWGSITTRTDGDGYIEIILPPSFVALPPEP